MVVRICLLGALLMGALAGFLIATRMKESRDLVRVPAMVAATVLVLVGVGQLGVVGILLGVVLLLTATPAAVVKPLADASHRPRQGPD